MNNQLIWLVHGLEVHSNRYTWHRSPKEGDWSSRERAQYQQSWQKGTRYPAYVLLGREGEGGKAIKESFFLLFNLLAVSFFRRPKPFAYERAGSRNKESKSADFASGIRINVVDIDANHYLVTILYP